MLTCEKGHSNPDGRRFCGDCGAPILPTVSICMLGHVNEKGQAFCGECGVPIGAPDGVVAGSSGGRWNVDPSGKHQYRYWDGAEWTDHVAQNGTFSTDPFSPPAKSRPETWVGMAAGVATLCLVIGAIVGIAMQLSGSTSSASETQAPPTTSAVAGPPAPPVQPSATPPPAVPAATAPGVTLPAVIGTPCRPNSSNSKTGDGSTAYCERLVSAGSYMWSLSPGDIPSPFPAGAGPELLKDPATAVCMAQTDRSSEQCVEYLQRPSDPGDGGRPAA